MLKYAFKTLKYALKYAISGGVYLILRAEMLNFHEIC